MNWLGSLLTLWCATFIVLLMLLMFDVIRIWILGIWILDRQPQWSATQVTGMARDPVTEHQLDHILDRWTCMPRQSFGGTVPPSSVRMSMVCSRRYRAGRS
jgi:hypothetical protein